MKKLYLLFSCMLYALFLVAQPTLQYPDNVPVIGDVVQIQFVKTDGLNTGAAGADVTWDYSGLESEYGGVITAIDPSQAPSGAEFPDADLALNMNNMTYTYVETNADGFFYLGSNTTFDTIESFRDLLSSLVDLYLSTISHRMNEVMKLLTIIATIFISITFVVGVYGMNFKFMPELQWTWGYGAVWAIMVGIAVAMLAYFKRKKWL